MPQCNKKLKDNSRCPVPAVPGLGGLCQRCYDEGQGGKKKAAALKTGLKVIAGAGGVLVFITKWGPLVEEAWHRVQPYLNEKENELLSVAQGSDSPEMRIVAGRQLVKSMRISLENSTPPARSRSKVRDIQRIRRR